MTRRALAGAALVVVLAACGETTYDESLETTTTAEVVATTTTLPSGPASTLLPRLATAAAAVGPLMVAEGDADAAAAQVRQLWDAVAEEVGAERPDLVADFDANVGRIESGVRFERAADADKAATNLRVLVETYLG